METTEHCFPTVEKELTGVEYKDPFYLLKEEGQLSNGIKFYKMEGYMESEVVEIGDLFKSFKDISKIVQADQDFGAFKRNSSTSASIKDDGNVLTISGYMPAADNFGIGGSPFAMNRNRYFEFTSTNTNRYLRISITPETELTNSKNYTTFYMLNQGMYVNRHYRILIDVRTKMAYVYEGETLITQKDISNLNFEVPHRVAISSSSTRNHTVNIRYSRESFYSEIPKGYLTLTEEGIEGDNIEMFTSTSMDGAIWEDYLPLDEDGKIQSSIGKFFKLKMLLKPYIEELTFKEYDYFTKDESERAMLKDGVEFNDRGLSANKKKEIEANRYLDGEVAMYRVNINTSDFRIDSLDFKVEAVE